MKTVIRFSPEVQAQLRSPSLAAPVRPLSFIPRSDVGRRGSDPLEYQYRYRSLREYAQLLALRYNLGRTRHAYYRHLRLLSDHFKCDPATLSESQVRELIRSAPASLTSAGLSLTRNSFRVFPRRSRFPARQDPQALEAQEDSTGGR